MSLAASLSGWPWFHVLSKRLGAGCSNLLLLQAATMTVAVLLTTRPPTALISNFRLLVACWLISTVCALVVIFKSGLLLVQVDRKRHCCLLLVFIQNFSSGLLVRRVGFVAILREWILAAISVQAMLFQGLVLCH